MVSCGSASNSWLSREMRLAAPLRDASLRCFACTIGQKTSVDVRLKDSVDEMHRPCPRASAGYPCRSRELRTGREKGPQSTGM